VRPSTQRRVVSALIGFSFLCTALFVRSAPSAASLNIPKGIICRDELAPKRREELAGRLRAITGWPRIGFNEGGGLEVGLTTAHGGSQTARNLITKALSGTNVIVLEDASNRQDVVFCRVVRAAWKHHVSQMPPTFVMLIDFADFDRLMGDQAALEAFDEGWVFLHEIDHVVNDSGDAAGAGEPGECEDHINLMRRECNLPIRTDYFFMYFPYARQSDFRTRFVRLAFDQENPTTKKRRRYWVMWDATLVGGLNPREIAIGR